MTCGFIVSCECVSNNLVEDLVTFNLINICVNTNILFV